ncbi:MAG: hypothetical protein AAF717_20305 [Bacteroidota bacterium]
MRKIAFFTLSVLVVNLVLAQEQGIKITNPSVAKEIFIKENKRVKIKTFEGEKFSGRFSIGDNNVLIIEGTTIPLTDIQEIKRNPLLLSIFTSSFFIYLGSIASGVGVLIALLGEPAALLLTIPGAALVYTGLKSPNFLRKFKTEKNWTFEIITNYP